MTTYKLDNISNANTISKPDLGKSPDFETNPTNKEMNPLLRRKGESMSKKIFPIFAVVSICSVAALFSACGGGGDSGGGGSSLPLPYAGATKQASMQEIASMNNTTGAAKVNSLQTFCTAAIAVPAKLITNDAVAKVVQAVSGKQLAKSTFLAVPYIPTTSYNQYQEPRAGTCSTAPGTVEYPATDFSHLDGTTKAKVLYTNYCTTHADGTTETLNGTVLVVSNGTPGASGPVISSYAGSIPELRVIKKDASGVPTSDTTIKAAGITSTPPGTPNDIVTVTQYITTDNINHTTSMLTNLRVTYSDAGVPTVRTESITGNLYLDTYGYLNLATKTPLVRDATGKYTAGTLTLTGSEGSAGTLELAIDPTASNGPVFKNTKYNINLNCSSM